MVSVYLNLFPFLSILSAGTSHPLNLTVPKEAQMVLFLEAILPETEQQRAENGLNKQIDISVQSIWSFKTLRGQKRVDKSEINHFQKTLQCNHLYILLL